MQNPRYKVKKIVKYKEMVDKERKRIVLDSFFLFGILIESIVRLVLEEKTPLIHEYVSIMCTIIEPVGVVYSFDCLAKGICKTILLERKIEKMQEIMSPKEEKGQYTLKLGGKIDEYYHSR